MKDALPPRGLTPPDYTHSPLLSSLETATFDADPTTRGKLKEAFDWLEAYTAFAIHADTRRWWMQEPLDVVRDLRLWNNMQKNEDAESFLELDTDAILPVSLLRLRALIATSGVDSNLYPVFLHIHETVREVAINRFVARAAHTAGEDTLSPSAYVAQPGWEIIHRPERYIDHDNQCEVIAFTSPDALEVFGFAARNLLDAADGQSRDERVASNYFFASQNQATAIYGALQSKVENILSPIYQVPRGDQFPHIALAPHANSQLTPLLSPWYRPIPIV